ncbi:MAG: hypothetical protein AAFY29_01590 [Pseudomonadota bacterium]
MSLSQAVELDALKIARGELEASIDLEFAARAQFVNNANVTEERAVKLYQSYVNCLESESNLHAYYELEELKVSSSRNQLVSLGTAKEVEEFDSVSNEYLEALSNNEQLIAYDAYRRLRLHLAIVNSRLVLSDQNSELILSQEFEEDTDYSISSKDDNSEPAFSPCTTLAADAFENQYVVDSGIICREAMRRALRNKYE